MHELSLYGSVSARQHVQLLQQLAGITRMQPQYVEQIHLLFKARTPPGLEKVQGSGGSQGNQQQQNEIQRLKNMLQSGIYFVQLIGSVVVDETASNEQNDTQQDAEDGGLAQDRTLQRVNWRLEFKDTPESTKQSTNSRLVSRMRIEDGEMIAFMDLFGFEYVNRYYVEGQKYYDQDTTLFIHRIRQLPRAANVQNVGDLSQLPRLSELQLLDPSGGWMIQAAVDIVDGNVQELKDRAARQLLTWKDTLRQAVNLAPADRLALDTRIPIPVRRI